MYDSKMLDDVYNMLVNANYKLVHIWITQIVFSWRWWIGTFLSVVPWIAWIKIGDKKNAPKLLFVGLVVMLVTTTLDNIGLNYNLWHYDWNVLPHTLVFIPWDYSLYPVGIMLILQYGTKINVYIKALGFASVTAFIFEPFFAWIGMYQRLYWEFWYSFIIYFPLYLVFNHLYKSKFLNIHNDI